MRTLKYPNRNPPGGWDFLDPDTKKEFRSPTLQGLILRIDTYRANNKFDPLPDTQALVFHHICSKPNMPKSLCEESPTPRSLLQYIKGAIAMVKTAYRGHADQETAEARALTCLNCPNNIVVDKHSKLRYYTDQAAAKSIGKRKTAHDKNLFSCRVCTCVLRVKVHANQQAVEEGLTKQQKALMPNGLPGKDGKPLYCWCIRPDVIEKQKDVDDAQSR